MAELSTEARAEAAKSGDRLARRFTTGSSGDRLFAAGLFIVGVVAVLEGLGYGFLRADGIIGPGFMPIVFGAVLIFCTVTVLVGSLRKPAEKEASLMDDLAQQAALESHDDVAPPERAGSERSAVLVAIGIGISLWLAGWIGLIPALTLLVFAILRWIEKESWTKSIVIAVVVGLGAWLIFTYFLQVPLNFGAISLYWHI